MSACPLRLSAPTLFVLLVSAAMLQARTTGAQTVVVPDDYPTIQAAINSPATRILVRNGTYAENLAIGRDLIVEPLPHYWDGDYSPTRDARPTVVGSITLGGQTPGAIALVGFHITGQAVAGFARKDVKIAECQIDGGITQGGEVGNLSIRGCIVRGGIHASGMYGDITGNTVLGGGITTHSSGAGCCMAVLGNYVVGPAQAGISFHDGGESGAISGNSVMGCEKGVVVTAPYGTTVADNVVMDCTGNAYQATGSNESDSLSLSGNTALRCGGNGFDISGIGRLAVRGNEADDCGGMGMRFLGCYDINSIATRANITDNRVLRSGSDGLVADGRVLLSRNIVGRSHGRGVVVTGLEAAVDHNTAYWNDLDGYDVSSSGGVSFATNVAYANQHKGLLWSGSFIQLACNDWFANVTGATSGVAPGATDLFVDPLFCNVPADNVHIATFSPLHNAPGCGLIGALDVGCSEPTGVSLPAARGSFLARPQPTMGALRFEWAALASSGEIEVYDATGARRWQAKVSPGTSGLDWRGADTGGNALPSGVYFARLTRGGVTETARVVIAR